MAIEQHDTASPAGWDVWATQIARRFGDHWLDEARTGILVVVPSVVARAGFNALVNPAYPDTVRLVLSASRPVAWQERLCACCRWRPSPGEKGSGLCGLTVDVMFAGALAACCPSRLSRECPPEIWRQRMA
ncbi:hypothetical protein [Paraburkholderia caffeinilytica]|uniref:hypothetical protein n=1 Tax=Paraburkholderia caffeinilytica TaxID=1761016 RepID=UPI003DA13655